jgi:hypothetical protein
MVLASSAWAQVVGDICGCEGSPESLGSFLSSDQATWPPGSTLSGSTIVVPLSEDGVMIFDSFELRDLPAGGNAGLVFARNDANSPVQLLVAGDVLIGSGDQLSLNGGRGQDGNSGGAAGRGAGGGPGGWRGGDGGYLFGSDSGYGGAGLGPGGGAPGGGTDLGGGFGGSLVVAADLLPLTGGSGGGGGSSQRTDTGAACGGGGGGGGALLIAADGTVTVNGVISADGGAGGNRGAGSSVGGGGGSGGAVRILANAIAGSGQILARAGSGGFTSGQSGSPGAIRLEAFSITIPATTSNVNPIAVRRSVPGPIALPLVPDIAITAIDGAAIPQPPLGWTGTQGVVDVVVPVAGTTTVEFETSGVPAGTLVDVSLVPRIGGGKATQSVLIDALDCDAGGDCIGVASVDLASGTYVVEARPTFQTP